MIAVREPSPPQPEWIDDELIEQTKAVWSPRYGRALTTPEAVEILLAMGRLIDAVQEQQP